MAAFAFEEQAREFFHPDSTSDEELLELKLNEAWNVELRKLSDEFQVPIETVVVIDGDTPNCNIKKTVSKARKWVKGITSPDDLSTLWEEAVDFYDYNIGWVFMETPSFGRHVDVERSDESVFLKFMEIGCRNFTGSKLIDVSGPRCSLIQAYELEWNRRASKAN